uniref:Mediator of RNA polymerase II transcription subunit 9 n=1 Tax=Angiostrongylus cantonensis TaxID=6313 RepID=A0A0K0DFF9_ANGCA
MSSGPFSDRAEADLISEEINSYFAKTGFATTLAGFLKFLLSIPNKPDQPTLALLEMLEIPHERLDTNALMTILQESRSELLKAEELNRKLKIRHNDLLKMFLNEEQNDTDSLVTLMNNLEISDNELGDLRGRHGGLFPLPNCEDDLTEAPSS